MSPRIGGLFGGIGKHTRCRSEVRPEDLACFQMMLMLLVQGHTLRTTAVNNLGHVADGCLVALQIILHFTVYIGALCCL